MTKAGAINQVSSSEELRSDVVEKQGLKVLPPTIFAHNRGAVTSQYSVMPPDGILASRLPGFDETVVRVQTAPAMGAQFTQMLLEIAPGGGMTRAREEEGIQHFFYLLSGTVEVEIDGTAHTLIPHGYAYVPVGHSCKVCNVGEGESRLLWIRKRYEAIDLPIPAPIVSHRDEIAKARPHTEGRYWQYLLPADDLAFDMNMNILGFVPGNYFPYVETHIMEHGLYMLEGQGLYLLGGDWHEVQPDDFIWMGAYCPQHFYCTGWGDAAYLLYKNVNRDVVL
jgi:(S)-ureidoglycine aminohydrolase